MLHDSCLTYVCIEICAKSTPKYDVIAIKKFRANRLFQNVQYEKFTLISC